MKNIVFGACLALGLFACGGGAGGGGDERPVAAFTEEERVVADQIISVFENDTPEIDYGYAENMQDGRGITAGRAGFTSATGDMLTVVARYTERVPDNPLTDYLPRLRELAADQSGSVIGLEGLEAAWRAAAEDLAFQETQDEIVDEEYYFPAMEYAESLGLTFPLSLLNLYDTIIQHGNGDDPDGLPAILGRATAQAGGTPADGVAEGDWLDAFMTIRRSVLLHASDPETREAWAASVGRADTLAALFQDGNLTLTPPIAVSPYGTTFTIPQ